MIRPFLFCLAVCTWTSAQGQTDIDLSEKFEIVDGRFRICGIGNGMSRAQIHDLAGEYQEEEWSFWGPGYTVKFELCDIDFTVYIDDPNDIDSTVESNYESTLVTAEFVPEESENTVDGREWSTWYVRKALKDNLGNANVIWLASGWVGHGHTEDSLPSYHIPTRGADTVDIYGRGIEIR